MNLFTYDISIVKFNLLEEGYAMKCNLKTIAVLLFFSMMVVLGLGTPAFAKASDHGLSVRKNDSYNKDGKFYMSFTINTGKLSGADKTSTKIKVEVLNSRGKKVISWTEKPMNSNKKIKRNYGYDWNSKLPSGSYTMKVTCTLNGRVYDGVRHNSKTASYSWTYKINHRAPSRIWFSSAAVSKLNNGNYGNKITLGHSGAKGKFVNLEIYNQRGKLVFVTKSSKPIGSDKGTYFFTWNGFPKGGGPLCNSGNYKLKFWITGSSPKQSTVRLDIF